MGRDKNNEKSNAHFARLERRLMEEPAWKALTTTAQALFPWLMLEWHGPNANNNGRIQLSVRQAADALGVNINTAAKAFHELQAKGFIVVIEGARLGTSGQAKGPRYELTNLGLPQGESRGGRRLYLSWREGSDFPVQKGRSNNPRGSNGKTKSSLKNEDRNVIDLKTNIGGTS